jgi:hypothetical protein
VLLVGATGIEGEGEEEEEEEEEGGGGGGGGEGEGEEEEDTPEDGTVNNHWCESIKFNICNSCLKYFLM